jgi:hypothetical protein
MRKLTPAMADLLEAMKRGVRVHYIGSADPYYFRADTFKPCTKQALGLIDRGLVVQGRDKAGRISLALTEREAG